MPSRSMPMPRSGSCSGRRTTTSPRRASRPSCPRPTRSRGTQTAWAIGSPGRGSRMPAGFNIVSDGIVPGSVQVPGDGEPIVMMADRQTTGGYPKLATVISADLRLVSQRRSGEAIRFAAIGIEEAQAVARERAELVRRLPAEARPVRGGLPPSEDLLALNSPARPSTRWPSPDQKEPRPEGRGQSFSVAELHLTGCRPDAWPRRHSRRRLGPCRREPAARPGSPRDARGRHRLGRDRNHDRAGGHRAVGVELVRRAAGALAGALLIARRLPGRDGSVLGAGIAGHLREGGAGEKRRGRRWPKQEFSSVMLPNGVDRQIPPAARTIPSADAALLG